MDVIVTDHHRPGDELPDCPVVHPGGRAAIRARTCARPVSPTSSRGADAAAGRDPAELDTELDIVALATVADVVPLVGENRMLVQRRAARARRHRQAGAARADARSPAWSRRRSTSARSAFVLAPRINAAGRLYRADAALELLLTDDAGRALEIARELDAINSERQAVETRDPVRGRAALSGMPSAATTRVYVLAGEGWHPGVIGIVASRLVERYHRPCVLIALDGDRGRGSGRSIGAYDLHAGLESCAELLKRFGGHRMAAGLEIAAAKLEPFQRSAGGPCPFGAAAEDLVPVENVDAIVSGDASGWSWRRSSSACGRSGWETRASICSCRRRAPPTCARWGRDGTRASRALGGRAHACRGFRRREAVSTATVRRGTRQDLVARLEANEWQGAVEPRLVLRSLHPVEPAGDRAPPTASDVPPARAASGGGLVGARAA